MTQLVLEVALVVIYVAMAAGVVLIVAAGALLIRREFWNADGTIREREK